MKYLLLLVYFLSIQFFTIVRSSRITPRLIAIHGQAQGTTYSIKYISSDSIITSFHIDSILNRIDSSLSLYKPYSLLSSFNQSYDCAPMDVHFKNVFTQSKTIAAASNACFDPTCKPLSELWGFGLFKQTSQKKPSTRQIQKALSLVGIHKLTQINDSVCKPFPSMKLDFDGIAQGYSVDVLSEFLLSYGIENFIVELGGEIFACGKNIDNLYWTVGLEDPSSSYDGNFLIKQKITLHNAAITTSGNYRKFRKLGNQYFSHIIDPHLGKPVNNGIISVTVIAENATLADGWDNALMVMGRDKALKIADSLPYMGIYMLYQNKDGTIKDTSNAFFRNYVVSN